MLFRVGNVLGSVMANRGEEGEGEGWGGGWGAEARTMRRVVCAHVVAIWLKTGLTLAYILSVRCL